MVVSTPDATPETAAASDPVGAACFFLVRNQTATIANRIQIQLFFRKFIFFWGFNFDSFIGAQNCQNSIYDARWIAIFIAIGYFEKRIFLHIFIELFFGFEKTGAMEKPKNHRARAAEVALLGEKLLP